MEPLYGSTALWALKKKMMLKLNRSGFVVAKKSKMIFWISNRGLNIFYDDKKILVKCISLAIGFVKVALLQIKGLEDV